MKPVQVIEVRMWGSRVGAVALDPRLDCYAFAYDPAWRRKVIEVAPLTMPLSDRRDTFVFPVLPRETYLRLPAMLADALPDDFGNALIDAWMATKGIEKSSITVLDRLAYMGKRGVGALEFRPTRGSHNESATPIAMKALVEEARRLVQGNFSVDNETKAALANIIKVGTSAGGARAKAVIAWNPKTDEVRSGQFDVAPGFEHWLLKFDGVGKDTELGTGEGYGRIEYAYSLMAKAAGVTMSECRLLEESGRRHFMSRRFDRLEGGEKLHMQSLCALAHFDFNHAGAYSYEQALLTIRQLNLPMEAVEEQFRRMTFNIIARNQDDHVKNIAFLMDKAGRWSLAPGFDMTYSYNPTGSWTATHQMTMNGKRDGFTLADFRACAKSALMKRGRAETIVKEVRAAVARWPDYAEQAQVANEWRKQIQLNHRLEFSST